MFEIFVKNFVKDLVEYLNDAFKENCTLKFYRFNSGYVPGIAYPGIIRFIVHSADGKPPANLFLYIQKFLISRGLDTKTLSLTNSILSKNKINVNLSSEVGEFMISCFNNDWEALGMSEDVSIISSINSKMEE